MYAALEVAVAYMRAEGPKTKALSITVLQLPFRLNTV